MPHAPPQTVDLSNNALFAASAGTPVDDPAASVAADTDSADAAGVLRLLAERLGDARCDVRMLDLRGNGIGDDATLAAPLVTALGANGGSNKLEWLNGISASFALANADKELRAWRRSPDLADEAELAAQLEVALAEKEATTGETWRLALQTLRWQEKEAARRNLGPGATPQQTQAFEQEWMKKQMDADRGIVDPNENSKTAEARRKVEAINKIERRVAAARSGAGAASVLEDANDAMHLYEVAFLCRSLSTSSAAAQIVKLNFSNYCAIGDEGAVLLAAALRAPAVSAMRGGAHLSALRVLDLRRNGIGDKGTAAIAKALACSSDAANRVLPVLAVGSEVVLDGLQSKPELNGTLGTISAALDVMTGRWQVKCASDGETRALKPANLTLTAIRRIEAGVDAPPAAELHLACVSLETLSLAGNLIGPTGMCELAGMLASALGCGSALQRAEFGGMIHSASVELYAGGALVADAHKAFEAVFKPGAAPALKYLSLPKQLEQGFPKPTVAAEGFELKFCPSIG